MDFDGSRERSTQHLEVPPRPGPIAVVRSRRSLRTFDMTKRKRIDQHRSRESAMAAEAAGEGPRASARTFPLNSRRLTASIVNRIAKELGVTGTA